MGKYDKVRIAHLSEDFRVEELESGYKKDAYKRYFNCMHKTILLYRKEMVFYDFLCEKMDSKNRVFIDATLKEVFFTHIKKVTSGKQNIKLPKVNSALRKFNALDLIFQVQEGKNTYYFVNPKYAFRGSEKDRKALILETLTERVRAKQKVDMLVDKPLDAAYSIKPKSKKNRIREVK